MESKRDCDDPKRRCVQNPEIVGGRNKRAQDRNRREKDDFKMLFPERDQEPGKKKGIVPKRNKHVSLHRQTHAAVRGEKDTSQIFEVRPQGTGGSVLVGLNKESG